MDRKIKLVREKSNKLFVAVDVFGQADVKYIGALSYNDSGDNTIKGTGEDTTKGTIDIVVLNIVLVLVSVCPLIMVSFFGIPCPNLCRRKRISPSSLQSGLDNQSLDRLDDNAVPLKSSVEEVPSVVARNSGSSNSEYHKGIAEEIKEPTNKSSTSESSTSESEEKGGDETTVSKPSVRSDADDGYVSDASTYQNGSQSISQNHQSSLQSGLDNQSPDRLDDNAVLLKSSVEEVPSVVARNSGSSNSESHKGIHSKLSLSSDELNADTEENQTRKADLMWELMMREREQQKKVSSQSKLSLSADKLNADTEENQTEEADFEWELMMREREQQKKVSSQSKLSSPESSDKLNADRGKSNMNQRINNEKWYEQNMIENEELSSEEADFLFMREAKMKREGEQQKKVSSQSKLSSSSDELNADTEENQTGVFHLELLQNYFNQASERLDEFLLLGMISASEDNFTTFLRENQTNTKLMMKHANGIFVSEGGLRCSAAREKDKMTSGKHSRVVRFWRDELKKPLTEDEKAAIFQEAGFEPYSSSEYIHTDTTSFEERSKFLKDMDQSIVNLKQIQDELEKRAKDELEKFRSDNKNLDTEENQTGVYSLLNREEKERKEEPAGSYNQPDFSAQPELSADKKATYEEEEAAKQKKALADKPAGWPAGIPYEPWNFVEIITLETLPATISINFVELENGEYVRFMGDTEDRFIGDTEDSPPHKILINRPPRYDPNRGEEQFRCQFWKPNTDRDGSLLDEDSRSPYRVDGAIRIGMDGEPLYDTLGYPLFSSGKYLFGSDRENTPLNWMEKRVHHPLDTKFDERGRVLSNTDGKPVCDETYHTTNDLGRRTNLGRVIKERSGTGDQS